MRWPGSRTVACTIREAILRGSNRRIAVVAPGALGACTAARRTSGQHMRWRASRVCANEYPDFSLQLIDFASEKLDAETLQQIARDCRSEWRTRGVHRGDERFGLRLLNAGVGADCRWQATRRSSRLLAPRRASLERVVWTRAPRRPPVADEVEIEVKPPAPISETLCGPWALPPELPKTVLPDQRLASSALE